MPGIFWVLAVPGGFEAGVFTRLGEGVWGFWGAILGVVGLNCLSAMPFIEQQLQASSGPIIAATDYVCAVPESVRAFLPADRSYRTLGTDGFGRSDTRAALRGYFGVDAASIVRAALGQFDA
jgi:hypothetical protein